MHESNRDLIYDFIPEFPWRASRKPRENTEQEFTLYTSRIQIKSHTAATVLFGAYVPMFRRNSYLHLQSIIASLPKR
jgi:hypothetical protein